GSALTQAQAEAAIEANGLGGGRGLTILHAETSGTKGVTDKSLKLKDGSRTIAKGALGKVTIDSGLAWGYGSTGLAFGTDGVRAGGVTGGTLTAVGVTATSKT